MSETFSATYEQILNDTVPQTPGVQRDVALRELRLAIREFFERSWAWTVIVEAIDAPSGSTEIVLTDGNADTETIGTLRVERVEGQALNLLTTQPTNRGGGDGSDDTSHYWIKTPPDTIRLWPERTNAETGYLNATIALMPAFDSNVLPDEVQSKFYDAIINGYLARVYMHPNKPYSAPQAAQYLRHNFMQQIGYYMGLRKTGGAGGQGWTYPPSWAVRRVGGNG